jgi:hypothetical protein
MNSGGLTSFIGGSPAAVALRLLVVSFIVGAALAMFGFEPWDIIANIERMARRLIEYGLSDFHQVWRTLLTGAIVVVPVWFVLRLLDSRRSR